MTASSFPASTVAPLSAPSSPLVLTPLPAFSDNYIWMLHDGRAAWVVDPGDAAPVLSALQSQGLSLAGILVTHHHADHVGGLAALRAHLNGPIYGPAKERIPGPYTALNEGDRVHLLGLDFEVFEVPGHTAGHIAYVQRDTVHGTVEAPLLFCGDTLFSAGCGRLFEGTPAQMSHSLARLAALPPATQVCCTHEYTLSNLKFAAAVEPENIDVLNHTHDCQTLRLAGRPTLPSRIDLEKRINPFLRCSEAAVAAAAMREGADNEDAVAVLAALREWKNRFR